MVALVILGLIISIIGLLGCILPILPGPPLSFLALILLSLAKGWEPFSATFLWIMFFITVGVTVLDYIVPAWGASRYGASKLSVWLSVAGMLLGIFIFPPWGIFLGALIGAVGGEILTGKQSGDALRAGLGVVMGNIVAIGLKLAASGLMLFYYVKEMF